MNITLAKLPRFLENDLRKAKDVLRISSLVQIFQAQTDRGKERYRRAALTGAASLFQRGLTILISFASVPLTIHYLGPERYGVWLTISSILVWLALTDFGLAGNALINVLSEAHGRDDKQLARQYVASAVWSLSALAAVLGIVTIIVFRYIPWTALFHSRSIPVGELASAGALTIGFFLLSLPISVQHAIYSGYQDGALSNACGIVMNLSSLAALIAVTQMKGGLPDLVLALSGTRLLVGLGNVLYIFRRYPWLVPVPSAVRWQCIRKLLNLGSKYLLSQLGAFGIGQSQPLIITQILGPAAVVPFVVAHRLITLPMDVVYMSIAPLVPAFGEAKARNAWGWIRTAYQRVTLASIVAGIPLVLLLGVIAQPVIRVWAGPAAVPGPALIIGLVLYNMVGVVLMGTGQLLTGVERLTPLVLSTVLCAIFTVGLGVVGCSVLGVAGVALAMALSKLVTFWPIQLWAVKDLFKSSARTPGVVIKEEVA
jgi:O-antigen/teichoic acid export membrane protein